jgi:hypothetical protein
VRQGEITKLPCILHHRERNEILCHVVRRSADVTDGTTWHLPEKVMIRSALWPLCFAFLLIPFAAEASCSFQFASAGGKPYGQDRFDVFIAQEIRPKLSGNTDSFTISITKLCEGHAPVNLSVEMDREYYITDIQDHHISPAETLSEPSSLTLSEANLESEFDHAVNISTQSTEQIRHIVKTFAFFLTESARFSDIEAAAKTLLAGGCTAQWLDYQRLISRWRVLSHFALHAGKKDWTVSGGSSGHLIAPVTSAEIARYNAAIAAGPSGPDHAEIVRQDWNTPLDVPPPFCAKHGG